MRTHKINDFLAYLSKFNVGDKLPGINQIAEYIGYDRLTIRECIYELKGAGILQVQHGKSTVLTKCPMTGEDDHW